MGSPLLVAESATEKTQAVCFCLPVCLPACPTDCLPDYLTDWLTVRLSSRCTAEDNRILPNALQMMTFLNPLNALIPKIPFSWSFAEFWVTSGPQGSVSVGLWGAWQLNPFFWGGGSSQRAVSTPSL